jgi:hypothetical protein
VTRKAPSALGAVLVLLHHVYALTLRLESRHTGIVPLLEADGVEGVVAHGQHFDFFTLLEIFKTDAAGTILLGFFDLFFVCFVVNRIVDFIGNVELFEWQVLSTQAFIFTLLVLFQGGLALDVSVLCIPWSMAQLRLCKNKLRVLEMDHKSLGSKQDTDNIHDPVPDVLMPAPIRAR